ncbi:hypothetical protein ES703_106740 [subsurface metagenome]
MPVLAEKAIEGAGLVENSQVFVAIFRSLGVGEAGIASPGATRTDPIGNTVSG